MALPFEQTEEQRRRAFESAGVPFPTTPPLRDIQLQGGQPAAFFDLAGRQASAVGQSVPATPEDFQSQLLGLLQQYQQAGALGRQTAREGEAEQARRLFQTPQDLIGASPGQQAAVRGAQVEAVEPTISGARRLVQESGEAISNFTQLLTIAKQLGLSGAVTPSKEVIDGYKNLIRAGGQPTAIPDEIRNKVLSALAPEDWQVWTEQNRKGVSDELTRNQKTATFNRIVDAYNRSPLVQAADRTPVLRDAIKNIRKEPANGALQLNLAYSYIQALDTYQSAVREGELSLVNSIDSKVGQITGWIQNIQRGQIVRPEVAKQIASAAEKVLDTISNAASQKARSFSSQAEVAGVGNEWNRYLGGFQPSYRQNAPATNSRDEWEYVPSSQGSTPQSQPRFSFTPSTEKTQTSTPGVLSRFLNR